MYHVLLAEDEQKIADGLKTLIHDRIGGFKVIAESGNGKAALDWLKSGLPDVFITDIRMPEMNGIETIRRVRELYPQLLIIIISGYGDFDYAREAIRYGVSDYLLKPVDHAELALALQKAKHILDERNQKHVQSGDSKSDRNERHIIRKVKEIVAGRLNQDISLQYIAEQVHMNHRYLSVLFKSETGMNFSEFVTECRMNKAKELLRETNLKVESVAELCGYANAKYFMSAFKNFSGETPTEYRNKG